MQRMGEVTAVEGEQIEVTFCRPADCGKCHACIGGSNQAKIWVKGTADKGDTAVVEMPASTVMKASVLAYVIPLIGLLGGAAIGSVMGTGDAPAAIGGAAGLAVTLAAVLLGEQKRRHDARWSPVLVQVFPADAASAVKEE